MIPDIAARLVHHQIGSVDGQNRRVLVASTAILFSTAILGPFLGISSGWGVSLSVFRGYLLAYIAVFSWFLLANGIRGSSVPPAIWLFAGIGLYAVLSLLSLPPLSRALFELFTLVSGIFVAGVIVYTAREKRTLEQYLFVVFGLVAGAELIAFWEIFFDAHLHTSRLIAEKTVKPGWARLGYDAASAWFHNQNNLAFFLALATGPLSAFALLASEYDRRLRSLAGIGVGLAGIIAWANRSRTALASIVVTVGVVAVLAAIAPRVRRVRAMRRSRSLALGAVFAGAIAVFLVFLFVSNPFAETNGIWKRYQLGMAGVRVFLDSWGLGVGVGNTIPAVAAHPIDTDGTGALHNWLLYFLASFGIVGAGLFLTAFGLILCNCGITALNEMHWTEVGLFGTMLLFPLNAIAPSNAVMTHSFWVFLGLSAAVRSRNRSALNEGWRRRL